MHPVLVVFVGFWWEFLFVGLFPSLAVGNNRQKEMAKKATGNNAIMKINRCRTLLRPLLWELARTFFF